MDGGTHDSTGTAVPVTLSANVSGISGTISGLIHDATDRDYVDLGSIAAGNTLFLSVEPSPNSNLLPVVSVYRVAAPDGDIFINEQLSGRTGDGVAEVDITETHNYYALVRGSSASGSLMSEFRLSIEVLPTNLADFANLQVSEVTLPAGGPFTSGDPISLTYTVDNIGAADTAVSAWVDRVALSTNNQFGDGDDIPLATVLRSGVLAAGADYTETVNATLPEGTSGAYFVIVRTDTADQVDEFLFEGDNELATASTFNVALADYPDIVIENLDVPAPDVSGSLTITWDTANRGAATAASDFEERIEVIDRITGGTAFSRTDTLSAPLAVDGVQARTVSLLNLAPSNYRLRITTDSADDLYEYSGSGHAAAESNVTESDFIVTRYFTVSTSAAPAEGGTVTPGSTIQEGNSTTVEAVANTAVKPYEFVRWKSAAGALLTNDPVYNFIPDANISLIAEFELPLYTLTTSRNDPDYGTVSGGGGFRWGSVVNLRANPLPGYLFTRWEDADDNSNLYGPGSKHHPGAESLDSGAVRRGKPNPHG